MMLARAPLLLVFLTSVKATCDQRIISDFFSLWDNKPPTGLMEWSVGEVTNVWMTENIVNANNVEVENVTCFRTVVAEDKTSARDDIGTIDSTKLITTEYKMVQDELGVFTILGSGYVGYMYVLFWKNDVMALYQCIPEEESNYWSWKYNDPYPVSLIGVKNYDPKSDTQAQDIESARVLLTEMKLDFDLVQMKTDCP